MRYTDNQIKAAWIAGIFALIAAVIGGVFLLLDTLLQQGFKITGPQIQVGDSGIHFPKDDRLVDALIKFSDLPPGNWQMPKQKTYTPPIPFSILIDQKALPSICNSQSLPANFIYEDITVEVAQIALVTSDQPPQQFEEWIFQTQNAFTVFDVIKDSLKNCENLVFLDKNGVRHTFSAIEFSEDKNRTYAITETIEPNNAAKFYKGTAYAILTHRANTVFYLYYMTGHDPIQSSGLDRFKVIVQLAIDKFSMLPQ